MTSPIDTSTSFSQNKAGYRSNILLGFWNFHAFPAQLSSPLPLATCYPSHYFHPTHRLPFYYLNGEFSLILGRFRRNKLLSTNIFLQQRFLRDVFNVFSSSRLAGTWQTGSLQHLYKGFGWWIKGSGGLERRRAVSRLVYF